MNVQTERIDNHKAQFTVEIEAKQLDEAKRKAAKKIAGQVRIKGFRKGKAPYRIVSQYVGEAAILEEAIELLGNDIYKEALDQSGVEPYGPGMLDDFQVDPAPTFTFSVPLQPEVELNDYLDVREDFETPEVTDEEVENALKSMQRQQAEVIDEEVEEVATGHRVTIDLHSEFADGEEPEDEDDEEDDDLDTEDTETEDSTDESTEDDAEDADEPYVPKKGDQFIHRHDATLVLEPADEPILPGFIEGLVGAKLDEDVEFELTVPDDDEDYKDIAGRKVKFNITINKIEEIETPELNDDFARKISEADGDEVVDLDGLRARTRDELEKEALENAKSQFGDKVLAKIIEGADVSFPELMLEEQIDDMLVDLDNNLQQQGINLETYMRITGTTKESLQEQYQEPATETLKRTLVLRELVAAQEVEIGDEQIEKRIDEMMIQFGGGAQSQQFRQIFDTPQMRQNMLNELLMDNIMTRLVAIGQGKDPAEAVAEREAEREAENQKARERFEKMMAEQEAEQAEDQTESETIDSAEDTEEPVAEAEVADESVDDTDEADESENVEETSDENSSDDVAESDDENEESDDED